jgi:hypothetical protein
MTTGTVEHQAMETYEIQYIFQLGGEKTETFNLRIDAQRLELIREASTSPPDWAELGFRQCPHCPLDAATHPYCPVAVNLSDVVRRFNAVISHDRIGLTVITPDRQVYGQTTAQKGISSLLGLIFPTSRCPHTAFFRPMARFHLPLATEADTIFRVTGMYLLAQFFIRKNGKPEDVELEGLKQIYENMHIINMHMADRIRKASVMDSSINAIIVLDVFTHVLPFAIEEQLEEIRYLFAPFFQPKSPAGAFRPGGDW